MLSLGLELVGFAHVRQQHSNLDRNFERFKSFYGAPPTTIAPFFTDLRNDNPAILYKDYFMTLNWLYLYESHPVLTGWWGYCEEYIGPKVISYAKLIAKIRAKNIRFEFKRDAVLKITVDCVNFTVQEFRLDPGSKWFDYKSHSCGLVSSFQIFSAGKFILV